MIFPGVAVCGFSFEIVSVFVDPQLRQVYVLIPVSVVVGCFVTFPSSQEWPVFATTTPELIF